MKKAIITVIILVIAATIALCAAIAQNLFNPYKRAMAEGEKALRASESIAAAAAFEKAIAYKPQNAAAYLNAAAAYIEQKDYKRTREILNAGKKMCADARIDEMIAYTLDNLFLEDVRESVREDWKNDFEDFVYSVWLNGFLYDFDCFTTAERDAVYALAFCDSYLTEKGFNYETEYGYEWIEKIPKQKMDWALKNYLNINPTYSLKRGNDYSADTYYYGGYYYASILPTGWEEDVETNISSIYDMGNGRYYFTYKVKMFDYDGSYYGYDAFYSVLERKSVDGYEFWSPIKISQEPIHLGELWTKLEG